MNIVSASLDDVLKARDARAAAQRRLLGEYGRPLVSFTMNIAGPVKKTPLVEFAFDAGLDALYGALGRPLAAEVIRPHTGCEALLVYDLPAAELKQSCLYLEAASPVGRLYDLDVLDTDGQKLSRPVPRACIVCGKPVTACSRSRAHGLEAVTAATEKLLTDFAAERLAALAYGALIEEVELTPKPGLVDRRNNGAHDDMNIALFYRSAEALRPYFAGMAAAGCAGAGAEELRALGREAEAAMFAATGGVNTHKGALYTFSLLLAAFGRCLSGKCTYAAQSEPQTDAANSVDAVFAEAAAIARKLAVADTKKAGAVPRDAVGKNDRDEELCGPGESRGETARYGFGVGAAAKGPAAAGTEFAAADSTGSETAGSAPQDGLKAARGEATESTMAENASRVDFAAGESHGEAARYGFSVGAAAETHGEAKGPAAAGTEFAAADSTGSETAGSAPQDGLKAARGSETENSAPQGGCGKVHGSAKDAAAAAETHGEAVRRRFGVGGVRAEAARGFPAVREAARRLAGRPPLEVLLWLMANAEDSNLYYRGGMAGAEFVKREAVSVLDAPAEERIKKAEALDDAMIARHLSPGGCADLLAAAIFISSLR